MPGYWLETVGYLPLALELSAVRVARGTAWKDVWHTMNSEMACIEVLEGPHAGIGPVRNWRPL